MTEFKSFCKTTNRKYNTWCNYTTRLDTYGCGCQHDCSYCYAKGLLKFRGLWNVQEPSVSSIDKIYKTIRKIDKNTIVKLGGMSDCFQPIELKHGITYKTIKLLNLYRMNYLIVTKSSLVSNDKYIKIYDKKLAHFQITITNTDDNKCLEYEKASKVSDRIKSIEKLYRLGYDVSVRLSPYIYDFIDFGILNSIKCDKIIVEYLKVNHWIKKWFDIGYDNYNLKFGGYSHLPLRLKIKQLKKITGFRKLNVGEYVKPHYLYFKENVNFSKKDCCGLSIKTKPFKKYKQLKLF